MTPGSTRKLADTPLPDDLPDDVRSCISAVREAVGRELAGVVFFGSRLLDTSPDAHSAADLFLVVDDYGAFYRGLREAGLLSRSPGWVALLNQWLPPNVLSLRGDPTTGPPCKCFVIGEEHFHHALSRHARDHFCRGRLTQRVRLIDARDATSRVAIENRLDRARRDSLHWVPLHLPPTFTVRDYCLAMLRTSFGHEIRPETGDRVQEVFSAQSDWMEETYGRILASDGPALGIEPTASGWVRRADAGPFDRLRDALYFRATAIRATLRWSKYVFTFEGWLDYIVHKVHRRTGMRIELSEAERRLPFLLLWPKFFRVLAALRRQRTSNGTKSEDR